MNHSAAETRHKRLQAIKPELGRAYAALDVAHVDYDLARKAHGTHPVSVKGMAAVKVAEDRWYYASEHVYDVFRAALIELSNIPDRPAF